MFDNQNQLISNPDAYFKFDIILKMKKKLKRIFLATVGFLDTSY